MDKTDRLDAFQVYRQRMNRRILEEKNPLGIKQFFNLLRARENSKE